MIDEHFLQSAISIRRSYLKITNNMSMYHKRATEVVKILEESVVKLDTMQKDITDNKGSNETSVSKLVDIIQEVENEGKLLESILEPMNKEIEKLAKEEQELYRQIKSKYPNIPDEALINFIQDRLKKEGL